MFETDEISPIKQYTLFKFKSLIFEFYFKNYSRFINLLMNETKNSKLILGIQR